MIYIQLTIMLRLILLSFIITQSLTAASPHLLAGSVTIPGYGSPANGIVEFVSYLVDYTGDPGDTLTHESGGCQYENGYYWVQCASFENQYTPGMVIHIDIWEDNGGSASYECVLTDLSYTTQDVTLHGSSLSDDPYILAQLKTCIEGAHLSGTNMSTLLQDNDFIPLASPYPDGRVAAAIPSNVVDWIGVELRTTPGGTAVTERSFFLRNDGVITDLDGTTADLRFYNVGSGDYYILIKHRNHLPVMSKEAQTLGP